MSCLCIPGVRHPDCSEHSPPKYQLKSGRHMANNTQRKDTVVTMYLDCVNNFPTVAKFAEHYKIPEAMMLSIVNIGRKSYDLDLKQSENDPT